MEPWIDELVNEYYTFLRDKTVVTESNDSEWIEISTPFIGLFNDTIDIFVKKQDDKIILSDDGNTLRNLELSGVEIMRSSKRKEILDRILANYNIKLNKDELLTEANERDFPQKKLNLISAIAEISDLYVLAKHTVASIFKEDVKTYLDEQEIIYTPHFISKGSSGLEFTFDFQIAHRNKEIVIKAFNTINKLNLPNFLFTWEDIKKEREIQSGKRVIGLAFINDEDKKIDQEYIDALNKYQAVYILWSERYKPENIKKLKDAA